MIIRCITHPKAAGETFFVSDGRDVSVTELIRLMAGSLQRRCILLPVPKTILKMFARFAGKQGEFSRLAESLQIDITKAKQLLDWMPPNSVEAEIARTASWYRQEMEQKKD
jgi:nucleoside-diphosphate-sugar epimerase